jgi:hypothetical protein
MPVAYRLTKTWPNATTQQRANWIASLMPGAESTAAKIGVSPEAIVTQAALETGWGRSAIGHNIFGIKASAGWTGKKQLVRTREVFGGRDVYIDDWFRDYDSYAESIEDHFQFLLRNSRYRTAGVFNAGSDEAYFQALQRAGYATDPNYASILTSVLRSVKDLTAHMERVGEGIDQGSQEPAPRPDAGGDGRAQPPPRDPSDNPADTPAGPRELSIGMEGEDVKALQAALNARIDALLEINGVFDSITLRAVMHFQKEADLDVDGIVGPMTRGALGL